MNDELEKMSQEELNCVLKEKINILYDWGIKETNSFVRRLKGDVDLYNPRDYINDNASSFFSIKVKSIYALYINIADHINMMIPLLLNKEGIDIEAVDDILDTLSNQSSVAGFVIIQLASFINCSGFIVGSDLYKYPTHVDPCIIGLSKFDTHQIMHYGKYVEYSGFLAFEYGTNNSDSLRLTLLRVLRQYDETIKYCNKKIMGGEILSKGFTVCKTYQEFKEWKENNYGYE